VDGPTAVAEADRLACKLFDILPALKDGNSKSQNSGRVVVDAARCFGALLVESRQQATGVAGQKQRSGRSTGVTAGLPPCIDQPSEPGAGQVGRATMSGDPGGDSTLLPRTGRSGPTRKRCSSCCCCTGESRRVPDRSSVTPLRSGWAGRRRPVSSGGPRTSGPGP